MSKGDLFTEMSMDSETRKSNKKRVTINTEYQRSLDSLLESVDELERGGDQVTRSTRAAQVTQLRELMDQKNEIEAEILKHAGELSAAYVDAQRKLDAAVLGRMQRISGSMDDLHSTGPAVDDGDVEMDDKEHEEGQSRKRKMEDGV